MPRKFLTASIVALFCCVVSFVAFADPPEGTASAASSDAGIAAPSPEVAPDAGPTAGADKGSADKSAAIDTSGTVAPDPSVVVEAVRTGNWRLVAVCVLIFAMFGLRRIRDKIPLFKGDRGGSILIMVLALMGAVTASLATSEPITGGMFLGAAGVAWTAVGGYTWVKRLIGQPAASMEARARQLYEVYCASSGGKNFRGDPCPAWPDLPEAIRTHWGAVAAAGV